MRDNPYQFDPENTPSDDFTSDTDENAGDMLNVDGVDSSDEFAEGPAPKNTQPELPPVVRDIERAMEYLQGTQSEAFGAMFGALALDEKLRPETPAPDAEEDPFSVDSDSLAAYDTPTTRFDTQAWDQELNISAYQASIAESGLALGPDAFMPQLVLADGEKFANTLAAIPLIEPGSTLHSGFGRVISSALYHMHEKYTPSINDDDYTTFSTPRVASQDTVHEDDALERAEALSASELLVHADAISDALADVGMEAAAADVRRVRTAETEGMLPHWAVAEEWDLFDPPTTHWLDRQWTQWETSDWDRIDTFLDDAQTYAPEDSRFMYDLAITLDTNIQRLIDNDLDIGETPLAHVEASDDDEDLLLDDIPYVPHPQIQAEVDTHSARLQSVQQRLRHIAEQYRR